MGKLISLLSFLIILLVSCGEEKIDQKEVVGNVAKQYYTYLLEGNYDAFVDGCYQKDSIRSSYRAELIENAKMFMGQQEKEHKGLKSIEVKNVDIDTLNNAANVFFIFTYGDGGKEQVLLPMIKHNDLWYMR